MSNQSAGKNSKSHVTWRLRRGMDRRVRSGHPWVYSNELESSPKGIAPGDRVELLDASGKFLAWGYGNPQSLIAFRVVSRDAKAVFSTDAILEILGRARDLRKATGLAQYSHRAFYGEADGYPGLVIDRYQLSKSQVFVIQAHTAGAQQMIPQVLEALEIQNKALWASTGIVLRNDIGVRKLEGLEEEEPRVIKAIPGVDLKNAVIHVKSVNDETAVEFSVDLLEGQKTGFFLDQFANIQLAALRFRNLPLSGKKIKILDLCCYVGQWGTQLTRMFRQMGIAVEVVAVDASAQALELAKKNIERQGGKCTPLKADVLRDLKDLEAESFGVVISDPPALIKSRKDIPAGTHAYLQLATQALRLVRDGGGIVCCSCSALLTEESFTQTLAKAAQRNGATVSWIGRGGPAPDHPVLAEFPEGRYLKGYVGIVTNRKKENPSC